MSVRPDRQVCVSVVSHAHGSMVEALVNRLLDCPEIGQLIVTENVPECLVLPEDERLLHIRNASPQGFGANHNAAFGHCSLPVFCPVNPDIILASNPFPALLAALHAAEASLAAPVVRDSAGRQEDSIRHFPGLCSLFGKFLGGDGGRYPEATGDNYLFPDWVAGMFMLIRSSAFAALGGFDPEYFLYYEDVDLCVRLWQRGERVVVAPSASVIHDARRASHRNVRHLRWHLASMARYFFRYWGRLPRGRGQTP